ncbi:MAG: large repetitive protein [Acetobacteraceae bacterium]|nr:large repetitive protein [Acetobacteraceae bacterium]
MGDAFSRAAACLGWVLFLCIAVAAIPGSSGETLPPRASESASRGVSIETKDGLVTATFSERTDDAGLAAAVPYLVARGVRSILLRAAPLRDIGPLARMSGLQALDICGTQVRDLTPLAGLTGLVSLNLQFLRIADLRPLSGLTGLRMLNLGGTDVRDLTPIGSLTELRELVAAVTKVKDLTPLAPLRELTSLNLGSTWVADVHALADMTNLLFLNLNGAPVDDIGPLARLVKLRTLDLGGTQVSDIQMLSAMRDLASLDLEGTRVADVTPLAQLSGLRSVALGGSRVKDMTPVAHLAVVPAGKVDPVGDDPVLVWNDLTNRAIQATSTDAFEASRALAIESIAVLDTIKSIDGTPAFLVSLPAPRDIPVNVAVAAAAHSVLSHLFPSRRAVLDAALAAALLNEPAGPALARAIAFGDAVAEAVVMLRDEDGSMASGASRAGIAPGEWRPTHPDFLPASHPQWATIHPFALNRANQFRPAGPPAPDTEAFGQARARVASLGAARSTTRTREQTEIAHYWSDAIGTYAPAGHWNAIAADFVAPLRLGIAVEAELFTELNVAMADAGIAMADAKYTYRFWRPITAIRAGGERTPPDPDWTPLLSTPNHPSYVSGHSSFSGAAATVLTAWFGTHPFTFSSASLPGVTRNFTSFQQAAEEAAASRVYGGIHYPFDNADGLATGRSVGDWTMAAFQRIEDRGPFVMMMDRSMMMSNMQNGDPRAVLGCAFDNVSPVAAVTVRLDGGAPFNVAVNDRGIFALPSDRLGMAGSHAAMLTATSVSGRSSTVQVRIE